MKTINLTNQQYLKVGAITICILLFSTFLFLILGSEKNFAGEASRTTPSQQGTWLVLNLEKENNNYQITKAYIQNYNKEKYNKFKEILPRPELRGLDSEITIKQIINRKTTTVTEPFNSKTDTIFENFNQDGSIKLLDYQTEERKYLEVKIVIDKIDLAKPLEILIVTPNNKQLLIKKDEFNKLQGLLSSQKIKTPTRKVTNAITGRAITTENSCDLIKAISTDPNIHSNNVNDLNRVNLIFIGHNYENKKTFIDSLPYYLDLNEKGLETYAVNTNTDETYEPLETRGIFHFVPFNENKNKFNFWYVDEIQEPYQIKDNYKQLRNK